MTAAVEPQAPKAISGPWRAAIIVCLMAGTLMQVLDATIANVALPYMQGSMSASREQITWVLTSYVISTAIMTAPVGWIAARFGRKNFYIFCLIGFTVTSALCGTAQSLEQIVLFRVLQGAIGAALSPLAQAMMYDMYPPERRGAAIALFGTGIMVGPILGPTIGGYITETLNWRWVFYINVPVGLAAAAGLLLYPSKGIRNPELRFDWTGFGLLALALGALQLMVDRGQDQGWFQSTEIIIYAIVSGLGLYLFVVHMATSENPFIPIALIRDVSFVGAFIGFMINGLVLNAVSVALPMYLQTLGGYSVLYAGLVMSPRGLGTIVAMQLAGAIGNRMDSRYQLLAGAIISMLTLRIMAGWTPSIDLWSFTILGIVQGFGMGFLFLPLNLAGFATIAPALRTDASAILNLARNLGGAMGVAISTAVIAANTQIAHANLAAHISPFNRPMQVNGPGFMWNPALPSGLAAINDVVRRQAEAIAYSDNFLYLSLLCLSMLAVLALVRKPAAPVTVEVAHMD